VQEGASVKKGASLYTVDLDTATKDGSTQQRIIEAQTSERDMLAQEIERRGRMNQDREGAATEDRDLKVRNKSNRRTNHRTASLRKESQ
jgi:hypothetical protein